MLMLRELQSSFCQSVTGDAFEELLHLIAGDGFEPAARLSIYRNNVLTRLTDTLDAAYPVVCQLVDRRFFDFAAGNFLRTHLPASGCLGEYGGDFPSFLAEFPPAAEPKYLPDVARLEWAIHQVQHAEVLPPISITALAAASGDPSLFHLHITSAVQFVAAQYGVDRIWIAHRTDTAWDDFRLENSPVYLQISGVTGLSVARLSRSTWEFRARLAGGESLGTAIATAMATSSDFDPPVALAALFGDNIVVGLKAETESSLS